MNLQMKTLDPNQLRLLKKRFEEFTFAHDFNLIYEHQVPNTGLVLLEGSIELKKRRRKFIEVVHPGLILGVQQLIKNMPFNFNCLVKGNSRLMLIPKSDILKIMNEKESELYRILTPEN